MLHSFFSNVFDDDCCDGCLRLWGKRKREKKKITIIKEEAPKRSEAFSPSRLRVLIKNNKVCISLSCLFFLYHLFSLGGSGSNTKTYVYIFLKFEKNFFIKKQQPSFEKKYNEPLPESNTKNKINAAHHGPR